MCRACGGTRQHGRPRPVGPLALATGWRELIFAGRAPLLVKGGRGRFRTCDPPLVRRVLSH
ncbi:hypothetical protein MILUP08_45363 [Micromonospora lupini str. Lupac 08]|uniref:Uncharacterized protein n=1 Tax=Micromonospora lupini str. Lupac 08 TaxID=1150864 RepID=I0L9I4_9ACTN|nr:hypothetical protein MILUP08_45363 [Micromonospora lupini str. Lupac 08]